MIFDIALMDTPSFLEGSTVTFFPFAPPDGVTAERAAILQGPMLRIGLIAGSGLVKTLFLRMGLVGDESVRARQGWKSSTGPRTVRDATPEGASAYFH
jgi:hypothetical protein